jgi:hypothetical protein
LYAICAGFSPADRAIADTPGVGRRFRPWRILRLTESMGKIRNAHLTILTSLAGITLAAGLAACSSVTPADAGSAAPSPSEDSTGTATPTRTPGWDPAVTAAWAAEAVPTAGAGGFVLAQNGHIEAGKPGAFTLQASSLAAGSYSLHLACRGDADTTVTVAVSGGEAATLSTGCAGDATAIAITTRAEGATLNVTGGNAAAVDWALAITDQLPG